MNILLKQITLYKTNDCLVKKNIPKKEGVHTNWMNAPFCHPGASGFVCCPSVISNPGTEMHEIYG